MSTRKETSSQLRSARRRARGKTDRPADACHVGEAQARVHRRRMTREDRAEHGGENGDASPVVEQALAVEDRFETARGADLAEQLNDRDRVGRCHDRAEKKSAGPVQAETVMGQGADQHHGQEDAQRGQKADRHHPPPHLVQVERQRGFEDEPGHEREQDQVRADRWQPQAGNEADHDASHREQHRIRNGRRGPRQEAQRRRRGAEKDEEEEKALRGAHGGRRPPADQPSRHTTRWATLRRCGGILIVCCAFTPA